MKANEFIKEYGLERAKEVLMGAPEWASHFYKDKPSLYSNRGDLDDGFISLVELKTAVDAYEIVNKVGGLELAQKQVEQANKHGYQTISIEMEVKNKDGKVFQGLGCFWVDKLEAAIKVVQS